ncbi:MAG: hypothetical protein Q7R56_03570 [Nanoarchaeota archaeon]|nr:hypothetical protein [Nanoarchaeota archaeon]
MKKGEVYWYLIAIILGIMILLFIYFGFIQPTYKLGTGIFG